MLRQASDQTRLRRLVGITTRRGQAWCSVGKLSASALLEDFARFWRAETDPGERRRLLMSLFAQVWAKDGAIIAVKPHRAIRPYFGAVREAAEGHPG